MIKYLQVENFKSLRSVGLGLGKLNLLFGCNGMGKSSLIQSVLLLEQSAARDNTMKKLYINGDLVELGTSQDILNQMAGDESIRFVVTGDGEEINVSYVRMNIFDSVMVLKDGGKLNFSNNLLGRQFCYLGAEHIGPQFSYSVKDWDEDGINLLGNHGEYVVPYLARYGERRKVDKILCLPAKTEGLLDQTVAWMRIISPGVRLIAEIEESKQEARLKVGYDMGTETLSSFSPVNSGFGISYVLPIIVALLISGENSLLLVENPESHLHPQGQVAMGRLMALAANHGAQIICESHSDHIINGVRCAVKNQKMRSEDLAVAYFTKNEKHETVVQVIDVDDRGNLSSYPKGLLDEWGNSMGELLK